MLEDTNSLDGAHIMNLKESNDRNRFILTLDIRFGFDEYDIFKIYPNYISKRDPRGFNMITHKMSACNLYENIYLGISQIKS